MCEKFIEHKIRSLKSENLERVITSTLLQLSRQLWVLESEPAPHQVPILSFIDYAIKFPQKFPTKIP